MSLAKTVLRRRLRAERRALNQEQQEAAALNLKLKICETEYYQQSSSIALYRAFDGEIDPVHIAQQAWSDGKNCYLPVLSTAADDGILQFYPWLREDEMQVNNFGIKEPAPADINLFIKVEMIDLLLMPLVGFDLNGYRLGMGGGYYDRTLADERLNQQAAQTDSRVFRVGVAHELQKTEHLPSDDFDQPMQLVVTDQAIYTLPVFSKA